jgi:peroxiredoxin
MTSCSWSDPKFTSGREGQALPQFTLNNTDSVTKFTTSAIPNGKPFILFLFRPDCIYCQAETDQFLKNMKDFKPIPIYLITSYSYYSIRSFIDRYHLSNYPNLVLLRDSAGQCVQYFNASALPYLAFYTNEKKLYKVLIGKADIDLIKRTLPD